MGFAVLIGRYKRYDDPFDCSVVVKMSDTQIRPSVKQKPGFVATTASFLLDESFTYSVYKQIF